MQFWVWIVCTAVGLGLTMQARPRRLAAVPGEDTECVAPLVKQLGDRTFAKREIAARELSAIGESALAALAEGALSSADPEIRQRAEQLRGAILTRSPGRLRIAGYDYDLPEWWDRVHVDVPTAPKTEHEVCLHVGERYGQWQGTAKTWREALKVHALAARRLGVLPVWVAHCHMAGKDYERAAAVYGDLCELAAGQAEKADWYRSYLGFNAGLARELSGDRRAAAEWYVRSAALYPVYARRPSDHDRAIASYAYSALRRAEWLGHFEAALTSTDPAYGTMRSKPVRVGTTDPAGPPSAARAYMAALRDAAGQKVRYERLGSAGESPEGHPIDIYVLTTLTGCQQRVFLDAYDPDCDPALQLAPCGFKKSRL